MARIVLVEDDAKQARLLRRYFEAEGLDVECVGNGHDAISAILGRPPDLVVLDVMLPRVDGMEVCRRVREHSDVPVLMLTARRSERDLLRGLDLGADDYMTKPYSPRELTARVRALLRRTAGSGVGGAAVAPPVTVGPVTLDSSSFTISVDGVSIGATTKEFAILELLMSAPGRVFSRAQIIESALGYDSQVLNRTVDAHVMHLRRKLAQVPAGRDLIDTIYGRGYRIVGPRR